MIRDAVKKNVIKNLRFGRADIAVSLLEHFKVPDQLFSDPMVQDAVKKYIIKTLRSGDTDYAVSLLEHFKVPDQLFSDPIVQDTAQKEIIHALNRNHTEKAVKIVNHFKIPETFWASPKFVATVKKILFHFNGNQNTEEVFQIIENFTFPDVFFSSREIQDAVRRIMRDLLLDGFPDLTLKIVEKFRLPEAQRLKRALRVFGPFLTYDTWEDFHRLLDGEAVPSFIELGIKKTGEAGTLELERTLRGLRHDFLFKDTASEPNLIAALHNSAFASVAKGLSRFTTSEWGRHKQDDWNSMLQTYEKTTKAKKFTPLPPEFHPSETLAIATLEETAGDFVYSKDFLERFKTLAGNIAKAQAMVHTHPEGGFGKNILPKLDTSAKNEMDILEKKNRLLSGGKC
jgi:hypothetical protein